MVSKPQSPDEAISQFEKSSKRSKVKQAERLFDPSGRPVIRHVAGELPEILDQAESALGTDEHLFSYAGGLARVYPVEEQQAGVKRQAGALMIHPVSSPLLVELLGRVATHERFDSRAGEWRACDCPKKVADGLIARAPAYRALRPLVGFVETPTITPDGRIIDASGYDQETGLYFAHGAIPGFQRPTIAPTRDDAQKAAAAIRACVASFPFVGEADLTAMIAGILTAILRRLLPAAPMFAITAPTPGTGKTLLCETIALIATNRRACVMSLGHDDAETEKRLTGVLLAGDAVISIDNIERPLKGDLLCQVTTQQFVRLRPLGGSGMLSIPTHAVIVATGNNLAIVGDLKRRVALIRLDAGTERPEQRDFDTDHLELIGKRRGALISHALTIVLAYIQAGAPKIDGLHSLGGFEQWDRVVRRPLVWLGLPDPLVAAEGLRDQDPDIEAMRLLYTSWHAKFGSSPVVVADVVAAGMETSPMSGDYRNPDLRDSLQLICAEKPNSRRLSGWLRRHQDRIVDGLTVKQHGMDSHSKVAKWAVLACG
jgi:putative DNA primase/helicase